VEVFTIVAHTPQGRRLLLQLHVASAQPSSRRKQAGSGTPPPLPGSEASLQNAALICIELALIYVREHLVEKQ
jgi:hypothetical protein